MPPDQSEAAENNETQVETAPAAAAETTTPAPAPAPAAAAPKSTDWRDDRISTLTGRNKELAENSRRMEERLRQYEQAKDTSAPANAPAAASAAEMDREVQTRAQAIAAQMAFNDRCTEAHSAGVAKFPDFNSQIANLRQLYDSTNPAECSAYNSMLTAALETGSAPEILHYLGGKQEEASRLLKMSPVRQAIELTKLASSVGNVRNEITGAPPPVKPVTGSSRQPAANPADPGAADKLSSREWHEARAKQIAERRRA